MKFVRLRLFGFLFTASLAMTACAPKTSQAVGEDVQPSITGTPEMIVDEVTTALAAGDVTPQAGDDAMPTPPGTGIAPGAGPKVASAVEAEAALTSGVAFFEDLAPEKYDPVVFSKPGIATYTVSLSESAPLIWSYAWCSENAEMLAANLENIELKFVLDDKQVSADSFNILELETGGQVCRLVYTSLRDWMPGEYHLTTIATFKARLNDGSANYEPGDYILDYKVSVSP